MKSESPSSALPRNSSQGKEMPNAIASLRFATCGIASSLRSSQRQGHAPRTTHHALRTTLLLTALLLASCSNTDRPTQSAILNPPTNSAQLELVRTITEPGNGGVFGSVGSVAVDDDGN